MLSKTTTTTHIKRFKDPLDLSGRKKNEKRDFNRNRTTIKVEIKYKMHDSI